MVSDIIKIGTKIDIMPDDLTNNTNDDYNAVFHSKVQDIFPNGDLEVDMPTVNGKLILLHNGVRYRVICYNDKATYIATAKVVDRYKSNNMFLLRLRIQTQFEKFQRREYFRCECTLDLKYAVLTEDDIKQMEALREENKGELFVNPINRIYMEGVALDISGGGVRFTSRNPIEQHSMVEIQFPLKLDNAFYEFNVIGNILSCTPIDENLRRYENRVQFTHIKNDEREKIIRYIFEQERKTRKLAGGR